MATKELISPEGLRIDGRRATELRHITIKMGLFTSADGSCYYEQGNTKILVAVYGPREIASVGARHDRAVLNCEYNVASFSTAERKKRVKGSRQGQEMSLLIQQVFESAVLTDLSPRSQIDIYVQVLQSDGGAKCASINAACLALIDAGVPMRDFVVSCSAGFYDKSPLLDLNYYEDSSGSPDMPVAILPKSGDVTLLQMDSKMSIDTFEEVLQCAVQGCQRIYEILLAVVKERTQTLLNCRGSFEKNINLQQSPY
jgi:exosome complex component RRP41